MNCQTCKHNKVCNEKRFADECYAFKPQTNADRIRAMTDEKLADYLEAVSEDAYNSERPLTSAEFMEWLKQEATE